MKDPKHKPIAAKRSLGQNFLVDRGYIERIVAALGPRKDETIIEIGPGRGALTGRLLGRAGRVVAVELDRELIPLLQEKFGEREDFELIGKDALEVNFDELCSNQEGRETRLVANLPYNISTAVLRHLIEHGTGIREMVVMLQKEVVERLTAPPGNRERGYLTVLIERYYEGEKLFEVPPAAFRPVPKVTSAVMRLITKKTADASDQKDRRRFEEIFNDLVSLGFAQKRKTIKNNLKNARGSLAGLLAGAGGVGGLLERSGVEPRRRAEELHLEEWEAMTNILSETDHE